MIHKIIYIQSNPAENNFIAFAIVLYAMDHFTNRDQLRLGHG